MTKTDLFKEHKADYTAKAAPHRLVVGRASYLAIEGRGAPGGEAFEAGVGALYGMAYTLKFAAKAEGRDFAVCKLEATYDVLGDEDAFQRDPDSVAWRLMIRVPDFVTAAHLDGARRALAEKKKEGAFDRVRLETVDEGDCVQILHVGPYSEERAAIETLRAFIKEQGLAPRLWHHEVYLNDPRRMPPERLKTILRQPVE